MPHEIVTEIIVPPAGRRNRAGAFLKLSKTAEDIAKVNAAVAVTLADGVVRAMPGSRWDRSRPRRSGPAQAEEALKGRQMTLETIDGGGSSGRRGGSAHIRRPLDGGVSQGDGEGPGQGRAHARRAA